VRFAVASQWHSAPRAPQLKIVSGPGFGSNPICLAVRDGNVATRGWAWQGRYSPQEFIIHKIGKYVIDSVCLMGPISPAKRIAAE
jgi:hypothetical protein